MKYCRCGNHKQLLVKLNFLSYSSNERTKCSQTKFNFNWSGNFFLSVSFSLCLRPILLVNYCRDSVDVKHNSMQCVEIESEITGETSHGWKWMVFGVRSWRALAIKINKFCVVNVCMFWAKRVPNRIQLKWSKFTAWTKCVCSFAKDSTQCTVIVQRFKILFSSSALLFMRMRSLFFHFLRSLFFCKRDNKQHNSVAYTSAECVCEYV